MLQVLASSSKWVMIQSIKISSKYLDFQASWFRQFFKIEHSRKNWSQQSHTTTTTMNQPKNFLMIETNSEVNKRIKESKEKQQDE